ncbi:MAG TPA: pyridoxamine 5'-phosphate oxidase family protein [Thermomicrobiales bacterium]|nr:pyridoxamine 5'-phosphate oxidase family protein [Thermomicrobiales bacterium]
MANDFSWTVERSSDFTEMADEFLERVSRIVWCNIATVDSQGRPRSRILHPYWEVTPDPVGWVLTRRMSFKHTHLSRNPYVSCAYVADIQRPVYAECRATWVDDLVEKQRIWERFSQAPAPMGYDPGTIFGSVDDPGLGLLRLDPWRVQVEQIPPGVRRLWTA